MSEEQVTHPPADVYRAIAACMLDLSKTGVAKDSKNLQQGYVFRGIDAVLNALSPVLAKHQLVILPRIIDREVTERTTQKGGVLFYVVIAAEFDFVSAKDGSKHTVRTFGEAMDSADKATNKAMSAAYKYAAFQTFCIPTEGDSDADATTHEVAPRASQAAPDAPQKPDGFDDWLDHMKTLAEEGTPRLRAGWKDSATEYRGFLTETQPKLWDRLKVVAAAKTGAGVVQ